MNIMSYLRLILFFSCITYQISQAQAKLQGNDPPVNQKWMDSLMKLLPGSSDDSVKVMRLINISRLQYDDENTRISFARDAYALAKKNGFKEGVTLALQEMGSVYQRQRDYNTAIAYYKKVIDIAELEGYNPQNISYYPALLNLYFYLGDYPNAMETISREMMTAQKNNDRSRIAHCNNILGYIFFKQENFDAAEEYYNRYIQLAVNLKDSLMLAHAYGEISDVYTAEKKYHEAIAVLFKTISISDSLLANPGKHNTNFVGAWTPQYKGKAFYRLSKTYKLMGNTTEARLFASQALEQVNHISFPLYDVASFYINAGDVFCKEKLFKQAIYHLQYGYNVSLEIQHRENRRDAAQILAQTYAALNRFDSAFYFHQVYTGLKDSIVNNETKMKIAGIQAKYDIVQKDREIARQQQIRNILIACFGFLLIVLLLLYNSYRLKQKNKYQQQLNRQQNELFNTIVTTQDVERKRIAQDIHDSLGSILSAAKLKLSSLAETKKIFTPDQLDKYQGSLDLLDEASTELRNISHNIMPATLSKLGLQAALQNLIDKLTAHSKTQIQFTAHGFEKRMAEATEISIYRIILELLNNIVKHADAAKVTIQLIKYPAYINLMLEDDGKGFDYNKAFDEKKGIGLGNIQSRVEYLNGSMDIDSVQGKGTTVIIEIPLLPA